MDYDNKTGLETDRIDAEDIALMQKPEMLSLLGCLRKKVLRPSLFQAGAVIADQGFCSIVNFLTGVLVARACTKSEYGVFVLGMTILRFMTGLQNSLVSVPYTIHYPRCKDDSRATYLGSTLVHQLVICILTAIGFFAASRFFAWRGAEEAMVSTMFMLSVASTAFMIREFIRLVMLAELRVWLNLAMSLFVNVATIAAIFIAYNTENLNSASAYLVIAVCSGVPALIVIGIYWQKMALVSERIMVDFKDNFHLGKWLVARSFANMGAVSIYPIALASFYGTAQAGVYGACFQLASLLNPIFMGLNIFLRPKFSHLVVNSPHAVNRLVLRLTGLLAVLLGLVFFVMLLVGNWAMIRLYGQDYDGYRTILLVCILAVSASVLSSPVSVAIDARKQTHITFKGRMIAAIFSLTIGLVCVWQYGVLGAAVSLFIAHAITCSYLFIVIACTNNTKSSPLLTNEKP